MLRFAANLTMLYGELAFLDRFAAAAEDRFQAVEFLFPYDFPTAEIASRLRVHGLELSLHNVPAGNWAAGERGIAALPDRVAEFRAGVERAIEVGGALGVPRLNVLAGIVPEGIAPADARRTLVDNLRHAAARAKAHGFELLLEPINTFDIPGFFVSRTDQALSIIEEVDASNLFVQFDIYHAQRMEGELAATLRRHIDRIGHIQLADNPGRNEPGTGEINFGYLFDLLDELGWHRPIGCEYKPRDNRPGGTTAGLSWLQAHGQSL